MGIEDIFVQFVKSIDGLTAAITHQTSLLEDGVIPGFAKYKKAELPQNANAEAEIKVPSEKPLAKTTTKEKAAKAAPAAKVKTTDVIEPTLFDKLANAVMALAEKDQDKTVEVLAKYKARKVSQIPDDQHQAALDDLTAALKEFTQEPEEGSRFV